MNRNQFYEFLTLNEMKKKRQRVVELRTEKRFDEARLLEQHLDEYIFNEIKNRYEWLINYGRILLIQIGGK